MILAKSARIKRWTHCIVHLLWKHFIKTDASACVYKNWFENVEEISSTTKKKIERPKTECIPENIQQIRVTIDKSLLRSSCRHLETIVEISNRTVKRILHPDLHCHLYKIQLVQALRNRYVSQSWFSFEVFVLDYWRRGPCKPFLSKSSDLSK